MRASNSVRRVLSRRPTVPAATAPRWGISAVTRRSFSGESLQYGFTRAPGFKWNLALAMATGGLGLAYYSYMDHMRTMATAPPIPRPMGPAGPATSPARALTTTTTTSSSSSSSVAPPRPGAMGMHASAVSALRARYEPPSATPRTPSPGAPGSPIEAVRQTLMQARTGAVMTSAAQHPVRSIVSGMLGAFDPSSLVHVRTVLTTASGAPIRNSEILAVAASLGITPLVTEGRKVWMDPSHLDLVAKKVVDEGTKRMEGAVYGAFWSILRSPHKAFHVLEQYRRMGAALQEAEFQARTAGSDAFYYLHARVHHFAIVKTFEMSGTFIAAVGGAVAYQRLIAGPAERVLTPVVRPFIWMGAQPVSAARIVMSGGAMGRVSAESITAIAGGVARRMPGAAIAGIALLAKLCKTRHELVQLLWDFEQTNPEYKDRIIASLRAAERECLQEASRKPAS